MLHGNKFHKLIWQHVKPIDPPVVMQHVIKTKQRSDMKEKTLHGHYKNQQLNYGASENWFAWWVRARAKLIKIREQDL